MANGITNSDNYTNIANSIRGKKNLQGAGLTTMKPPQMSAYIDSIRLGCPITVVNHYNASGEWERPSGWPNLDNLTDWKVEGFEGVYLTYDNTGEFPCCLGFYITCDSSYTVELGKIENNAFTTQYTYTANSNAYFELDYGALSGLDDYVVVRVKPTSGHITRWGFGRISTTTSGLASQINAYEQPCLERVGALDYMTIGNSSGNNYRPFAQYIERDAMSFGNSAAVTSLGDMWNYGKNLQKLETDRFTNTSNWAVTSLVAAWYCCYSLQSLDLSDWDTSNWAVTSLVAAWYCCYSLQSLDLSDWDTSNWAVTSLQNAWNGCYSLQSLDLSDWDTSNWTVTNLGYAWQNCYSLQSLDLSSWDTSNWTVTNLGTAWSSCYSLQSLDLSDWDTSNWTVTNLTTAWNCCYSLQSLDLSEWDTSNWTVTSLQNAWQSCYSLQSLDLSDWDTSNWTVTSLGNAWNCCYSLQSLDLSEWDTSNWTVTSLQNAWNGCYSLQSLDLSDWDTSNWTVTNLTYAWQSCYSLKVAKISTILYASTCTNFSYPNYSALTDYYPYSHKVNTSYSVCHNLTRASLLRIIASLETVTSAKTLTLGSFLKMKLTDAEIQVATDKGWSIL